MASALAAMFVGVGAPAMADRPVVDEVTAPGNVPVIPFQCGDVVGEISGTSVQRVHTHERADGTDTFLVTIVERDSLFTTEDGQVYRVVGSILAKGYYIGDAPDPLPVPGPPANAVLTFRRTNLVVVGEGGQLGALHERIDGETRTAHGGCDYLF